MSAYTNAVAWLLISPVALCGLVFAGLMIISFRSVYRSIDVYLLSVCAALFLNVAVLVCLQGTLYVRHAPWTRASCEFYVWCASALRFAEVFTLVALSIERVLILHLNVRYQYRGTSRVHLLVLALWLAAMFVGGVPVMGWTRVAVVRADGGCAYLAYEVDRHFGVFLAVLELFAGFLAAGCLLDVLLHMRHLTRHAFFTPTTISSVYSVDITLAASGGRPAKVPASRVEASLGFATAYDNSRFACVLVLAIFLLNHIPHIVITLVGVMGRPDPELCHLASLWFLLLEALLVPHLFWVANARYRRRAKHVIDALLGREAFFDDGGPDEIYLESYFKRMAVAHPAGDAQATNGNHTQSNHVGVDGRNMQTHLRKQSLESGTRIKKSDDARLIKKSNGVNKRGEMRAPCEVKRPQSVNRACSLDTHLELTEMMEGGSGGGAGDHRNGRRRRFSEDDVIYSDVEGRYGAYLVPVSKRLARSLSDISRSHDRKQKFGSQDSSSTGTSSVMFRPRSRGRRTAAYLSSDDERLRRQTVFTPTDAARMRKQSRERVMVSSGGVTNAGFENNLELEYTDLTNEIISLSEMDTGSETGGVAASVSRRHLGSVLSPGPPKTPSDTTSHYSGSSYPSDDGATVVYSEDFIDEVIGSGSEDDTPLQTPIGVRLSPRKPASSSSTSTAPSSAHSPSSVRAAVKGGRALAPPLIVVQGPPSAATALSNGLVAGERTSMPTQVNPLYQESFPVSTKPPSEREDEAETVHTIDTDMHIFSNGERKANAASGGIVKDTEETGSEQGRDAHTDGGYLQLAGESEFLMVKPKLSSRASSTASDLSWVATPIKRGDGSAEGRLSPPDGINKSYDPPPAAPPLPPEMTSPCAPFTSPVKVTGRSVYYPSPGSGASREVLMEELMARLSHIHAQTRLSEADDTSEHSTLELDTPPRVQPVIVAPTIRNPGNALPAVRGARTTSSSGAPTLQRRLSAQRAIMQEAKRHLVASNACRSPAHAPPDHNSLPSSWSSSDRDSDVHRQRKSSHATTRPPPIATQPYPVRSPVAGPGESDRTDGTLNRKYSPHQQSGGEWRLLTREQLESLETQGRGKVIGYYPNGSPAHALNPEAEVTNRTTVYRLPDGTYEPEIML